MRPGTEPACRVQRRLRLVEPSAAASTVTLDTTYQRLVALAAGKALDVAMACQVAPSVDQSSATFMFVADDSL